MRASGYEDIGHARGARRTRALVCHDRRIDWQVHAKRHAELVLVPVVDAFKARTEARQLAWQPIFVLAWLHLAEATVAVHALEEARAEACRVALLRQRRVCPHKGAKAGLVAGKQRRLVSRVGVSTWLYNPTRRPTSPPCRHWRCIHPQWR